MYSIDLVKSLNGTTASLQVVFLSHNDRHDDFEGNIEKLIEEFNRRLPPSRLLFICPVGMEGHIKECFSKNKESFEKRLKSTSHIVVAPYDERGNLVTESIFQLLNRQNSWDITDDLLVEFGNDAVAKIFNDSRAILYAPHGYVFRKLSGQEEEIFVRAENMLREPNCLAVFDYLLIRKLPPNCSVLFIDSFTILSFALSLQSLIRYFQELGRSIPIFSIDNIHSYEMDPEFRIPNEANYFFLISASTSGGLRQQIIKEKQADINRVIHLVGVGQAADQFSQSCLLFEVRKLLNPSNQNAKQENKIIQIDTEEFQMSQGPPRPVRITRNHVNTQGANEICKPYYCDALKFNEPGPSERYSTFSISTNIEDPNELPIRDWVHQKLIHELPASIYTVIHATDFASTTIASWICDLLGPQVNKIELSKFEQTDSYTVPKGKSVVIVSYFDPDLEILQNANICCRDIEDVHRHFVLGYGFPATSTEHNRLKSDLCMGDKGPQYGWSEYFVLPVGSEIVHESLSLGSFPFSAEVIENYRGDLGYDLANFLIAQVNRTTITSYNLFLPRADGSPLKLRHDSVFFPGKLVDGISQIAVYAMVSAAIQSAREPSTNPKLANAATTRFDDNPFVRAVLDPRMFARYSDGILQASLIRSAQPSELDYSSSIELSHRFTSICKSIFLNNAQELGDAAIEFVHALVTEKVALRKDDREKLFKVIDDIPKLKAFRELLDSESR